LQIIVINFRLPKQAFTQSFLLFIVPFGGMADLLNGFCGIYEGMFSFIRIDFIPGFWLAEPSFRAEFSESDPVNFPCKASYLFG